MKKPKGFDANIKKVYPSVMKNDDRIARLKSRMLSFIGTVANKRFLRECY